MKLLLLDAGHCLGRALIDEASRRSDVELIVECQSCCDAERLREIAPDAVIFPPLCTPVALDHSVLVEYVARLDQVLEACRTCSVSLCWFVSDQVFEAGSDAPIEEGVLPAPRHEGLELLLAAGVRVRERLSRYFIIRTGPLIALEGREGLLGDMLENLYKGHTLRAADDEIVCPTSACAVARATIGMLAQQLAGANGWGVYHLAGVEPVSLHTFHTVVLHQLDLHLARRDIRVVLGSVQPLQHHHDQPLRRVLNCRRVLETFGVHQKPWRLALDAMLERWCDELAERERAS